jgi:beta-phosphoglucomutase-like phosphatase (HAD superfamily)
MVLEDSPTGIQAAQTAGCQVVQVMADGMEEVAGVGGRLRSLTVTAEDLLALLGSR